MPVGNRSLVIANGGAANQMLYWSRPGNWKDQALTPNPNTIYFNPFYDTTKGPVVLEIPPVEAESSITGSIDDAWQCALDDVGPAGVDQGNGGKYLITPPGYKETPPSGYIIVPSDTYQGFAILRSNFNSGSDADIAAAVAGIAKGKPFTADAKTRSILDQAARAAGASIDKWYKRGFSTPFFEGTVWSAFPPSG
jgi:hypothetical protein